MGTISPSYRRSPVDGIKNTLARPNGQRGQSVVDLVGRTPLLRLREITRDLPPEVRIWAKLEGFNPGGSVKDRPALHMLQAGIASGALRSGKTIIDSTSGNTGIALALYGAALGLPVELVLPTHAARPACLSRSPVLSPSLSC